MWYFSTNFEMDEPVEIDNQCNIQLCNTDEKED